MRMLRRGRLLSSGFVVLAGCAAAREVEPVGWQVLATGSQASLRGLAAVDGTTAFVGGAEGTLLRTADGGRSWVEVAPPDSEACDFRDLEAFDRDHVLAMVAGQPARVYRTDDGGGSWQIVYEDRRPAAFFDAMAFRGTRGVLFGDAIDGAFELLQSSDAGRSWQLAPTGTLPPPESGEAGFAASGTCVATARGDACFSLVTGGGPSRHIRWAVGEQPVVQPLPLRSGVAAAGAFSVAWRGSRAVVVGGDYSAPTETVGTAAWSDDGVSFHAADAGGFRSAVVWLGEHELLAVGSDGASWSRDSGRTWRAFGELGFHSVCVARDGTVWACGSDGRVAKLIVAERVPADRVRVP